MGRIARVIDFARKLVNDSNQDEVKVQTGGGITIDVTHTSSPGDDSSPLLTDYAIIVPTQRTGQWALVGYVDPRNAGIAQRGDKRIFSRAPVTSESRAQVWLKNSGDIVISNDSGAFTLLANGDVNINGFVIDAAGNAASPGSISADSIVADGKELAGHLHPAGEPPGNTGPNL